MPARPYGSKTPPHNTHTATGTPSSLDQTADLPAFPAHKPTVCLGVTYVMVCTYGCDDGRIGPPRCAVIDAALGGRCTPLPACSTPPVEASSARSALAARSAPGS